MSKYNKKWC